MSGPDDLLAGVLEADPGAMGRAITRVLAGEANGRTLTKALRAHTGAAHRVGITGPPGVGKSTLVAALSRRLLADGAKVGVVASDPASRYTGGAFLGDRVRLAGFRLTAEPRLFFRSVASRTGGGVDRDVALAADVIDAAGFPWILLETVGVGQAELAVADVASTVVVVLSPDLGDEVQILKAGILEIADILVVNRADASGARKLCGLLEDRGRAARRADSSWNPPVVATEAVRGQGVDDLARALKRHREHLRSRGEPPARMDESSAHR